MQRKNDVLHLRIIANQARPLKSCLRVAKVARNVYCSSSGFNNFTSFRLDKVHQQANE